ncbi:MAG: chorismate synthase [Spirochaeta sp. LUC14_002_19_P3]|nr:MAG: chorismate synthase [Spirochaeta sp. LUC14_002_19_P3]
MPGNSFGRLLSITTFGESHGAAVGVIVDGLPPGMEISEADIQTELNRRRPGQSELSTPRDEADRIAILSGIFEGRTTGVPLAMMLHNTNIRSSDYNDIADKFRPGHADFTYQAKYGLRDWRGSGRASGRETAARVAAGAIAKKWLKAKGVHILAWTQMAAGINCEGFDAEVIEKNPLRACDLKAAEKMAERIRRLMEQGDSAGGIIQCRVSGLPAGLGNPVFDKLEAELGHAILSIGAIRGFEIGAGFAATAMKGSEHNDAMNADGFISNHAGGVIGGISTGQELVFRAAVKPTSSISLPQSTRNIAGETVEIRTEGRHDPIICPRIVPVIEAMTALVLMDAWLIQAAQRGLK